jgi:hypothetical protein
LKVINEVQAEAAKARQFMLGEGDSAFIIKEFRSFWELPLLPQKGSFFILPSLECLAVQDS